MRAPQDQLGLFDPVFDTVTALIVVLDANGKILRFNKACQDLTGYEESDVLGQSVVEILIPPADQAHVRSEFQELKATDFPSIFMNPWLTKAGDKRLIQWSNGVKLSDDGEIEFILGTGVDLTERKGHESLFAERGRYLSALLDTSPIAVIRISPQAVIEEFSPAAQRLFGYEPGEIVGKKVNDLMPEPFRTEHDGYIERYLRTGEKRIIGAGRKVPAIRKDGAVFPMWLSVGEMEFEGDRHFVGFIQDLSDTEQAQSKIAELQHELQQVARLSAMGEIAAAIAHELNQPLTAASSFAEAAKLTLQSGQAHSSDRAIEMLEKAVNEIIRSGQIIRRIRQFVSSDDGRRTAASMNDIVSDAGVLALIGSTSADIQVRMNLDGRNPHADMDSVQIQQVLINLIRNAVDAMTETESNQLIVTTSIDESERVRVSVTDTGPGIDESVVARLFEPFVTTKREGMGIGLSVCKTIIDAHGGELWAEPNTPRGTVFSFTLPLSTAT